MQRFRSVTPPSLMRSTSSSIPPFRLGDHRRSLNNEKQLITASPCAKLFLGDLSYHCSEKEIEDEFSHKGYEGVVVKISLDMHGKTRGYGFAELATMELASQARDELQGMKLHGRHIRINYAGRSIQDQTPINTLSSPIHSVYIRFRTDLDITFDEAYLETFFYSYGSITDVCIKDICKMNVPTRRSGTGDRRYGSASIFSHQEGFGFVHFEDAAAAIKAAESVKGDEHTSLNCQFSNNLCRSLDGLGNQSPRPLSLSFPTTAATGHDLSPRHHSGGHVHSTTSNNQPISLYNRDQSQDQFHSTWPPSNNPNPNPNPSNAMMMVPMNHHMPLMSPHAYATQGHHHHTMVHMPPVMTMPPTAYHPSSMPMPPMAYPAPPMNMHGAYFYNNNNNGDHYYNNGMPSNGMQPVGMPMPPSTMYYNPHTVPVHAPHIGTAAPLYRVTYQQCVYPNNNNTVSTQQFPVVQGDQVVVSDPIYCA